MRIKRWLMGVCTIALAIAFGITAIGTTVSAAKTVGHVAKKHKKVSCPKGTKKKGKVCVKTVTKTVTKVVTSEKQVPVTSTVTKSEVKEVTKEVPVTKEVTKEVPGPTKEVTKEVPGPTTTVEVPIVLPEQKYEPAVPKELGEEPATLEAGGTKAIEHATEIPAAPTWTASQLNAYPAGNWIGPEGGTTGDHFSKLKEITASNVKELKGDWMTGLDNSGVNGESYSAEASPVEYDGVLYYITGADDVFAVSAANGHILWVHPGALPASVNAVCCGWDARGLSIGEDRVYVPLLTGSVEALNQETGKLEWKTELGQPAEGLTVTSAPLYYEGMVFIGPVGSEYGVRGFMEAFNAKTGAVLWKHYNIPGLGEAGHSSWPTGTIPGFTQAQSFIADDEWKHGGATNWNAPTVDPRLHEILYSTANAGNDYEGFYREGDNLWAVSMLALNYQTGELKWGYQEVHHDIWDYDASNQPTMIDVEIGGKKVEGIVQSDKDGFAYFVNAETGEPVTGPAGSDLGIEEQAVPALAGDASSPTQPIPKMPPFYPQKLTATELASLQKSITSNIEKIETEKHEKQTKVEVVHGGYKEDDVFGAWAKEGEEKAQVSSEALSGDNEAPSSYDPENSYYYVCSRKGLDGVYMTGDAEPVFKEGSSFAGADYTSASSINSSQGWLTAYNMKTGEIAWMKEWPHECYSGITTTAGNILITGTVSGEMLVYNATTGEELLKFQLGAGIGSAETVYEYGGKERIGIYAGGNDFDFSGDQKGDLLWQLSLSGTLPAVTEKYYTTHTATNNTTTHEEEKVPSEYKDF